MLALRLYSRAPIRVASLSRVLFADILSAEPHEDVYAVSVTDHKTARQHGPAELFVYQEELDMLKDVSFDYT